MSKLNLATRRKVFFDMLQHSGDRLKAANATAPLQDQGHPFAYGTVYKRKPKLGETDSCRDAHLDPSLPIGSGLCGPEGIYAYAGTPAGWIGSLDRENVYIVKQHIVLEGVCRACRPSAH